MTTTTQRFRRGDADWTPPKTTTKITTRSSPLPKIPRDEQVRIARPLGGGVVTRRPTPLDLRLAQAKSTVRLVSNDHDVETLRDPEIVDLAGAPRNWTARRQACPPYTPRQPPPVPPKPRRVPPPSVASRQSEMSFGILDYYIHDPSPAQSPSLPLGGTTPVVGDTAIERFDFGLGERRDTTRTPDDAKSGADDDEMQLIPLSPRPFEEDKSESPPKTNRKKKQYSLFPAVQEVTPSSNRLAQVINESPFVGEDLPKVEESTSHRQQQESSWRPRLLSGAKMTHNNTNTRHRTDTVSTASPTTSTQMTFPSPTTTVPSPSYHPRKSSRSFSINMNNTITTRLPSTSISSSGGSASNSARGSSSTTSGRTRTISNPHHIPLRILSSSSSATTATANTTSRSSVSTSPGSTLAGQQKPLLSRWSEDTALASPTTAAHALATGAGGAGCRASFGSLLMGDGGLRTGEVYPDCFFEDDDDDFARPLRRSRRTMGRGGQRVRGWKWFFCWGRKG